MDLVHQRRARRGRDKRNSSCNSRAAFSALCVPAKSTETLSMKKLLYILGGLLVLAIVGVVIVLFSLGSIVKAGINNVGPRITQSKVELLEANISPFSGAGTLKGLTVGNPVGWQTPRAFYLKEISIELEPKSLKGDHIVINRILIDQPEITYETTITNSNLQDLLKNIQQAAGGSPQPSQQ